MIEDMRSAPTTKGLVKGFSKAGFQATELAKAVSVAKQMKQDKDCVVFLAFTSNLVASGVRGLLAEVIREGWVDVVVTAGGAIDHDIIKSFLPYGEGSFFEDDVALHKKSVNRLGNILVPNDRYVLLEKKVQAKLKEVYGTKKSVSQRELVSALSTLPNDEDSFLKACLERKVPVFCPGLIDSAIGLQLFFFKQDHRDFVVDVTADMKELADIVLPAKKTGAIVLGGGISKHFTIGSNLLRDGLDYAVYFTTATPFDGSLSGAVTNEAKSWGKIRGKAKDVTVHCPAEIGFPLLVSALK